MSRPAQAAIILFALSSAIIASAWNGNLQAASAPGQPSADGSDRLVDPQEREAYVQHVRDAFESWAAAMERDYSGPSLAEKVEIAFRRHGGTGPVDVGLVGAVEFLLNSPGGRARAQAAIHGEILQFKKAADGYTTLIPGVSAPADTNRPVKVSELRKLDMGLESLRVYDSQLRSIYDELIDLRAEDEAATQRAQQSQQSQSEYVSMQRRAHRMDQLRDVAVQSSRLIFFGPLHLEDPPSPQVVLFAKGVNHLILVGKLYQSEPQREPPIKVPLVVGVLFDKPFDGDEYAVTVDIGAQRLDLVAKPMDDSRMIFLTEAFSIGSP